MFLSVPATIALLMDHKKLFQHYLVTVLFQKKEYQILQKPYIILDTVYQLLQ